MSDVSQEKKIRSSRDTKDRTQGTVHKQHTLSLSPSPPRSLRPTSLAPILHFPISCLTSLSLPLLLSCSLSPSLVLLSSSVATSCHGSTPNKQKSKTCPFHCFGHSRSALGRCGSLDTREPSSEEALHDSTCSFRCEAITSPTFSHRKTRIQ